LRTSPTEDFKHALVAESFTVINNFLEKIRDQNQHKFVLQQAHFPVPSSFSSHLESFISYGEGRNILEVITMYIY